MSQKFDLLKRQLQNVDKAKAGQLVKEIRQAYTDGKISKEERTQLLTTAKQTFGKIDFSILKSLTRFGRK